MKPSVILAVLIGITVLTILSGCTGGSDKDNPLARATEAYKDVDGPESASKPTPLASDSVETEADSLYTEGMEYNLAGRASQSIDEAIQNYRLSIEKLTEAIRLVPENDAYYAFRGDSYFRLEQYDEALNDIDHAIRIGTESPTGVFWAHYLSLGITNIELGQNQRAVQGFDKAIELNPNDAMIYHFRSIAYLNLGRLPTLMPTQLQHALWRGSTALGSTMWINTH